MKKLLVVIGMVLGACGSDDTSTETGTAALAAYDATVQDVAAAVEAYQGASTEMATPDVCATLAAEYADRMEPLLERLQTLSRDMDGAMRGCGETAHADVECAVGQMRERAQAHIRTGCALGLEVARANAARHSGEMLELADHLRMRAAELEELQGQGAHQRAGWMSERGRMVGWDHEVPACTGTPAPASPGCTGDCDQDGDGTPDQLRDRDGSCDATAETVVPAAA